MGEQSELLASCHSDEGILSEAKDTRQNWRLLEILINFALDFHTDSQKLVSDVPST